MKQLYVITESGGQYDDAWEHVRFVTDDREKAELYCDNQNERDDIDSTDSYWYVVEVEWLA